MAASVAFLHQVEYEAALNEYEAEAQRQNDGQDADVAPRQRSSEDLQDEMPPAQARQLELRRSLLRGPSSKAHGGRTSSAVANWLSAQGSFRAAGAGVGGVGGGPGPPRGPGGAPRPSLHPPHAHPQHLLPRPRAPLPRQPSVAGSLRRTASALIERPSLWYRLTHVDVRGVIDSLVPIYTPDTLGRRAWDLAIMVLVVWTVVTVPLSVSYGLPHSTEWNAVGYAITLLFAVDLIVNFRTAFYNHQGELIRDSSAIAANYMKFWFWIDLFGTIPFDTIVLWTGVLSVSSSSDNSTTLAALGFLKAPRMLRLGRLLRFLDSFRNAKVFRIAQLFMAMLLISHWLACVWYMMYRFGGKQQAEDWAFEIANEGGGQPNELSYYMISYYYSFLLLVGDNITAYNNFERTFFVVVLIAGTFFYSAVVGQMATLVATMNVAVNRHGQKLLMVQDALRYAGVPERFSEKVQLYFEYLQQRSHPGAEGMQFLQDLPASLHLNLCEFLHRRGLSKVPLFKDCEEGFLSALSLRMRMISLSPSEVIFRVGDAGKEMYIIRKGCVAVTSPSGQMWGLLVAGEIFGEVALLSTGKRTANCTALGFVDLAVLHGPDLQVVMRDYPVSAAIIHERAEARARALQEKSKMWLQLSDDEDDFYDLVNLDGEGDEEEQQQRGSGGSRSNGGSGDAEAAEAASVSSSTSSSATSSGRGRGSPSGSGSGDGAAIVAVATDKAAAGTPDGGTPPAVGERCPSPTATAPASLEGRTKSPAGSDALGRPSSPRPTNAITGRPLPIAWHERDSSTPRQLRPASAAPAAAGRASADGGLTQLEVPRISVDLVARTPTPAADTPDSAAGPNRRAPYLGREQDEGHGPHPYPHSPSPRLHRERRPSQGISPARGTQNGLGSVLGGAAPSPPGLPDAVRPRSAARRSSGGVAPAGRTTPRQSEASNPSPRVSATAAAAAPALGTSVSRTYRAAAAGSRRQRDDDSWSAQASEQPPFGTFSPSQRRPPGRQQSQQQRSMRRRSMAFWLQEEAEVAGLAPPAVSGAAAAGDAEASLRQDAEEIPWLAPPPPAQRRRSSCYSLSTQGLSTQGVSSGAATGTGMHTGEAIRARRGSAEPFGSPRPHMQHQQSHQQRHQQQQSRPPQRHPQGHGVGPEAVARQPPRGAGPASVEAPAGGGGEISVRGGEGEGGDAGGGGGGEADEGDVTQVLLRRLASSRTAAAAGPGGVAHEAPARQGSGWITPRRDGGMAAGEERGGGWWAPAAEQSAAAAAAAAAVAAAIAGDKDWEDAAAAAVAASAAAYGGGGRGGRPGPIAEAMERKPLSPVPSAAAGDSPFNALLRTRRPSMNVAAGAAGSSNDPAAAAEQQQPRGVFGLLRRASGGFAPPATASPDPDGAPSATATGSGGAAVGLPSEAAILRLTRRPSIVHLHSAASGGPSASAHLDAEQFPSPFMTPGMGPGFGALSTRRSARLSAGSGAAELPQADSGGAGGGGGLVRGASSLRVTSSSYAGLDSSVHAGGSGDGGGGGDLQGAGEMEWISTRVRRRSLHRRGSTESIHEEDLAALAPASALVGAASSSGAAAGASGTQPGGHGGGARWRRGSAEGALTYEDRGGGGRRRSLALPFRLSLQGIQRSGGGAQQMSPLPMPSRRLRSSASGLLRAFQAAAPPPPPPPPPPPDGVFVPRESWNQLLQAVSKLSLFEDTVTKLLDLVTEQDAALTRLEARAERAAAMGGAAGGGVSTSVLGIVAPSALTAASVGAAAAAGSGAAGIGPRTLTSQLLAHSKSSGLSSGQTGTSMPPLAPRGRRSSQTLLHGSSAAAAAAAAAVAAVSGAAAASGEGADTSGAGAQSSGAARMRIAVRAMAVSSRLRSGQAGLRVRAAAARAADGSGGGGTRSSTGDGAGNDSGTDAGAGSRGCSGNGDNAEPTSPGAARLSSLPPTVERSSSVGKARRASQAVPGAAPGLRSALKSASASRELSSTGMLALRDPMTRG